MTTTFIRAEWEKLVMANYAVDSRLLDNYLPNNTEYDLWNNTCYVSLVGFMFLNTTVMGVRIPGHANFAEVNLRFYVRHKEHGEWKRGVVFIKEIVPKRAITFIANTLYHEHYETMPMRHSWKSEGGWLRVEYQWKKKRWNSLMIVVGDTPKHIDDQSEEQFITDHYWGYSRRTDQKTYEYGVLHPSWQVYTTQGYAVNVDFGDIYGPAFSFLNRETPRSVFLAEGSEIQVTTGRSISSSRK